MVLLFKYVVANIAKLRINYIVYKNKNNNSISYLYILKMDIIMYQIE